MLRGHAPGRSSDLPYWDILRLKIGERVDGWLAGPCVGYLVHHVGTSRPCLTDVTGGEVPCRYCDAKLSREWRGYVPIWDELLTRRVALIGRRYYHLCEKVKLLQPVTVRKLKEWGQPVCVQRAIGRNDEPTLRDADKASQELGDWLVQMWREPSLTEWVAAKAGGLTSPKEPPAEAEVSPMNRAAAKRAEVVGEVVSQMRGAKGATPLGDVVSKVLNGVHKPKRG